MSSTGSPGNESQTTDEDVIAAICDKAWSQGDLLPDDIAKKVLPEDELKKGARAVVVSHDCDLVHHSLENEPVVEVLLLHAVAAQGDLTQAKNPRRIHLPYAENGMVIYYEAFIHRRLFIDRRLLAEAAPVKGGFDADARDDLRQWLAKRYVRAAFPTEFDKRISGIKKKLKKALDTQEGKAISGIYIFLDPDAELPAGTAYKIIIRGTMRAVVFDESPLVKKCESLLGKMAALFASCDGIEVLEHAIQSEARFSVDEVRLTKRWDADFLSADDGDAPVLL